MLNNSPVYRNNEEFLVKTPPIMEYATCAPKDNGSERRYCMCTKSLVKSVEDFVALFAKRVMVYNTFGIS